MNYLIIGAGMSGRGFIPQFLNPDDRITFLDKNDELLRELQEVGAYSIEYYTGEIQLLIENYSTVNWNDVNQNLIDEMDYILISVGMSNIKELLRNLESTDIKLLQPIFLFENGLNPAKQFTDQISKTNIKFQEVSQAAIFTTTVNSGINIKSEYHLELLYDSFRFKTDVPFNFAKPVLDFELLMRRKILTYNFLSAVIAYHGYYKGYKYLAEAANDKEIKDIVTKVKDEMDVAYANEFEISYEEQSKFSQNAITKFSNNLIEDSIQRNSRDSIRKLASEERLFGALKIMRKQGVDYSLVIETIALAIYYAIKVEAKTLADFTHISSLVSKEETTIINERVEEYVARKQ